MPNLPSEFHYWNSAAPSKKAAIARDQASNNGPDDLAPPLNKDSPFIAPAVSTKGVRNAGWAGKITDGHQFHLICRMGSRRCLFGFCGG